MNAYKVMFDVTCRYTMEIHAETRTNAEVQAEQLSKHQVEAGGDFEQLVKIEIVDIENLYPSDDEDEPIVQETMEVESEPGDDTLEDEIEIEPEEENEDEMA